MKQLLVFLTLFAFSGSVSAQETKKTTQKSRKEQKREKINAQIKAEEEGVIAYRKHFAFGIKLVSDGYGITFEKGYSKSVKKTTNWRYQSVNTRKK